MSSLSRIPSSRYRAVDYPNPSNTTHPDRVDQTSIQAAIDAAGANGGGIVEIPEGTFSITKSLLLGKINPNKTDDMLVYSNIILRGAGRGTTKLVADASLDGRNDVTHNNVICALNLTHGVPYDSSQQPYTSNLAVEDLTINAVAQNLESIPTPIQPFGYSSCAIEFQNVHRARCSRLEIIGAFGNGIVSASIDPKVERSVEGAIIEDCIFIGCVRGRLKQYSGIVGSVIQYGAMRGGVVRDCRFDASGGPAVDFFNCEGTTIEDNLFVGGQLIPKIEPYLSAPDQTINSINSDFGLINCSIVRNTFRNAGVIFLNGRMIEDDLTSKRATPGPQSCTISDNHIAGVGMVGRNSSLSVITLLGGGTFLNPRTSVLELGTATGNVIQGNTIRAVPQGAVMLYDGRNNVTSDNVVIDAFGTLADPSLIFAALTLSTIQGALNGSQGNLFTANVTVRNGDSPNCYMFGDNGPNNRDNVIIGNVYSTTIAQAWLVNPPGGVRTTLSNNVVVVI